MYILPCKLFLAFFLNFLVQKVGSYASYEPCGNFANWIAGAPYGQMNANSFSTSTSTCNLAMSSSATSYTPGQTFQIQVTTPSSLGIKIVSTGGATLSSPNSGGNAATSTCLNWDGLTTSATAVLTAPSSGGGQISVKAICGNFNSMFVATDLILAGAPTAPTPPTAPTVSTPPTPMPSTAGAPPPAGFTNQIKLNQQMVLFYNANATHVKFQLQMSSTGYVAIGTGTLMVGSASLIGMDPTVSGNSGYPAVGLYNLVAQVGSNSQITKPLATTSAALLTYGISQASYSSTGGTSTMSWTIEIAKQQAPFNFVSSSTPVNFCFAGGGPAYGFHTFAQAIPNVNFVTGAVPTGAAAAFTVDPLLVAHIFLMILSWSLIIPFGIIIPLFNSMKRTGSAFCGLSRSWLKYHWTILTFGVFLNYIGLILGYSSVDQREHVHWVTPHERLGLVVLFLSIIQPVVAAFRPKTSPIGRKFFPISHRLAGYFILLLAIIDNYLGVENLDLLTSNQPFNFGPLFLNSGFSGQLGVLIIILSIAIFLTICYGFLRNRFIPESDEVPEKDVDFQKFSSVDPQPGLGDRIRNRISQAGLGLGGPLIDKNKLKEHASESSCWVTYEGKVYDVTNFLNEHPGGKKALFRLAGKDITQSFYDVGHSKQAKAMLTKMFVGNLNISAAELRQSRVRSVRIPIGNPNIFLSNDNQQRKHVTLVEKTLISHNVYRLKFALPSPNLILGLPTGQHIAVYGYPNRPKRQGYWNNEPDVFENEIRRMYTPISNDEKDKGTFTLVVKVYRPSSKYPDGGRMSSFFEALQIGKQVQISGPFGMNVYLGRGIFECPTGVINTKDIVMIAAGSGITPIYQIASAVLRNPFDSVKIKMLYANSTADDILLKDDLDQLEKTHGGSGGLKIWYTVSQPPKGPWKYSVGRISKKMFEDMFPSPSVNPIVIICGPQTFLDTTAKYLDELGYPEQRRIEYEDAVKKARTAATLSKPIKSFLPPQQPRETFSNPIGSFFPPPQFQNSNSVGSFLPPVQEARDFNQAKPAFLRPPTKPSNNYNNYTNYNNYNSNQSKNKNVTLSAVPPQSFSHMHAVPPAWRMNNGYHN